MSALCPCNVMMLISILVIGLLKYNINAGTVIVTRKCVMGGVVADINTVTECFDATQKAHL